MKFSACIEWLFADEAPVFADRIRAAKDAGLDGVEFWRWTDKDLDAIEAALHETGLPLAGIVAEPMIPLTDPGPPRRVPRRPRQPRSAPPAASARRC